MPYKLDDGDELLTPGEVARLFRVDPKTVSRWAHSGKLEAIRTPGGHHRFRRSQISKLMNPADGPNAVGGQAHGF
jgi:excisionase family DNA binding protein